jgi:hypothetical protein
MALVSAVAIKELPVGGIRGRAIVIPTRALAETSGQLPTGATIWESTTRGTEVLEAIKNGQAMPAGQPETSEPSTASLPASLLSSPVFEAMFDRLGRWTGRSGSRQAQQDLLRRWIRTGEDGAFWLVRRVAEERNLEALDGASTALEAMSAVAAPHIVAALASSNKAGDTETALKLLRILEWFPAGDIVAIAPSLTAIVERSASHASVELREAAYRCVPLLPNSAEVRARALTSELDPELRSILEEQQP